MRRQLVLQAAAVTSMVALAFVIPLAILVGDFAKDRALTAAEREAENVARYMALLAPLPISDSDLAGLRPAAANDYEVSVVPPDGTVIGAEVPGSEDLSAALEGTAERVEVDGGASVYLPVIGSDGRTSVVRVFAPDSELRAGVTRSWLILAALGASLVLIAVLIADRIGKTIVKPVYELSASAEKLGAGDLAARVTPSGPPEVRAMGVEFNRLADQIDQLVVAEREAAADLSHRLRTPLAALRLDAEALEGAAGRERVLDDLSSLERTVDYVIDQARRGARSGLPSARANLAEVVGERATFWQVLAEDQGRTMQVDIAERPAVVAMESGDASALIDALIENVFAHTPEGAAIAVSLVTRDSDVLLGVEDGGPGLPDLGVLERGRSEGSSSGLGLDIVRKLTERSGGDFRVGSSRRLGGALIAIRLPLTPD